jgi:hypothetical protein
MALESVAINAYKLVLKCIVETSLWERKETNRREGKLALQYRTTQRRALIEVEVEVVEVRSCVEKETGSWGRRQGKQGMAVEGILCWRRW